MNKKVALVVTALVIGGFGGFFYLSQNKTNRSDRDPNTSTEHHPGHTPSGEWCAGHEIAEADCPWCMPSLIKSRGTCPEHNVPEALCTRCNPALIAGFKVEGDWCAGHILPESQCLKCQAGDLPPDER